MALAFLCVEADATDHRAAHKKAAQPDGVELSGRGSIT
jgi:hypothetical protein